MQLDPELGAAGSQPLPFPGAGARKKGDAIAEPCGRRGRVHRRAPNAPLGVAFEFVARGVPNRDEIKH